MDDFPSLYRNIRRGEYMRRGSRKANRPANPSLGIGAPPSSFYPPVRQLPLFLEWPERLAVFCRQSVEILARIRNLTLERLSQIGSGSGLEAIAILRASYELGRHL
jgi:hypothetical protein